MTITNKQIQSIHAVSNNNTNTERSMAHLMSSTNRDKFSLKVLVKQSTTVISMISIVRVTVLHSHSAVIKMCQPTGN